MDAKKSPRPKKSRGRNGQPDGLDKRQADPTNPVYHTSTEVGIETCRSGEGQWREALGVLWGMAAEADPVYAQYLCHVKVMMGIIRDLREHLGDEMLVMIPAPQIRALCRLALRGDADGACGLAEDLKARALLTEALPGWDWWAG